LVDPPEGLENILYTSVIKSIMYAMLCIR